MTKSIDAARVESLNDRVTEFAAQLARNALNSGNMDIVRDVLNDSVKAHTMVLDLFNKGVTYKAWLEMFHEACRLCTTHRHDTTGEFTKLVDEMLTMDLEAYYNEVVVPLNTEANRKAMEESLLQVQDLLNSMK